MNTQNMTAHYEDLEEEQVKFNLLHTAIDYSNIPTHMLISTGAVSTTDSVTPTLGFPLASTLMNSVANAVANGLTPMGATSSNAITGTTAKTTAGSTLGLSAMAQWNQSWAVTPQTDPDVIRRLRALYRYATDNKFTSCDFFQAYSIQRDLSGDDIQMPGCFPSDQALTSNPNPSSPMPWTIYGVNPNFIEGPGCVLCIFGKASKLTDLHNPNAVVWMVKVNKNIEPHFVTNTRAQRSDVYLGTDSETGYSYFAPKSQLHEFELAILESVSVAATTYTSPAPQSPPKPTCASPCPSTPVPAPGSTVPPTVAPNLSPGGGNPVGKSTGQTVVPIILTPP